MKIKNNSKIFQSKEFLKDKIQYTPLFSMLETDNYLFYSDEENYIIGRGEIGYPSCIWTKENIHKDKIRELLNIMKEFYIVEETNEFTCKKELYEELKDYFFLENYFELGFLTCNHLKSIKSTDGYMTNPNYADKITLAKYWMDNCIETYPTKTPILEESLEEVSNWLDNNHFIWKNKEGKIVSMACTIEFENLAKISHVFTPKEERNKGYCSNLIWNITKKLLEEKKIPYLYTNYQYKPSNETYKKVGYEDKGYLISFTIRKEGKNE